MPIDIKRFAIQRETPTMILKSIYLELGDPGLSAEYVYGFRKSNRFICNYLERECFKRLKYKTSGFARVVVSLTARPKAVYVNSCQVACVGIADRRDEYDHKTGEALTLYCIERLKEGLAELAVVQSIPDRELRSCLDSFVSGRFVNEWVHKKRKFVAQSIEATLFCSMNQDAFTLRLKVTFKRKVLFDEIILVTDPGELAFKYRFNEIELSGDMLAVVDKWSKPLKSICLSELLKAQAAGE